MSEWAREWFQTQDAVKCLRSKVTAGWASAVGLGHPLGPSWLTGAGRGEDVGVADAQLQVEEAGGGGDAAVPGVGLLHRVAVLQGVDAHPGLIWRRDEQMLRKEKKKKK